MHLCSVNQNKNIKFKRIDKYTYINAISLMQCLLLADRRTGCGGSSG